MMLLITNANNKFRFLTMYFLLSKPIELYMTSRVFMKYSALHSLYCILHVWQGKSIIIKTESHFSPVSFCLFEGACLTQSDTWPFQKNSNSIKKKLQLNVSLQELKRQDFGIPSPLLWMKFGYFLCISLFVENSLNFWMFDFF